MASASRLAFDAGMEAWFKIISGYVALVADGGSVACIAIGIVQTLARALKVVAQRLATQEARREVWTRFAGWIVLSLEFALAADIVRTAIAPSWDDIGRLGAIALIRTGLNYFLERDLEVLDRSKEPERA